MECEGAETLRQGCDKTRGMGGALAQKRPQSPVEAGRHCLMNLSQDQRAEWLVGPKAHSATCNILPPTTHWSRSQCLSLPGESVLYPWACFQECARYLETFKAYESKPAVGIQERVDRDYARCAVALLGLNRNHLDPARPAGGQQAVLSGHSGARWQGPCRVCMASPG